MEQYNIAQTLVEIAARAPFRPAVIFPAGRDASGRARYVQYSFRQLDQESDRYAHGLAEFGVRDVVVRALHMDLVPAEREGRIIILYHSIAMAVIAIETYMITSLLKMKPIFKTIINAIIDKDARVGDNVSIINAHNLQEKDDENYSIRDGIIVVPKGSWIRNGTVI